MRKLINNVAGMINDLCSIKQLDQDMFSTICQIDPQKGKYFLTVNFIVSKRISDLCLKMLQEIRDTGYEMDVVNQELNRHQQVLSVTFYEP